MVVVVQGAISMIDRRRLIVGAALATALPRAARAVTPLDLSEVQLKPFSLDALPGIEKGVEVPTLELLKGHITLVNVWGSWCSACRAEHNDLLALKAKGLRIAGVNARDRMDAALRYLKSQGNPFELIGVDTRSEFVNMLAIRSYPQSFLIGPRGEIAWQTSRALDGNLIAEMEQARAGLDKAALEKAGLEAAQ